MITYVCKVQEISRSRLCTDMKGCRGFILRSGTNTNGIAVESTQIIVPTTARAQPDMLFHAHAELVLQAAGEWLRPACRDQLQTN